MTSQPLFAPARSWRQWRPGAILSAALATVVLGGLTLAEWPRPAEAGPVLTADIRQDGNARFDKVVGDKKTRRWSVSCRLPLRGCVARAPSGILLTASPEGVRLLASARADTRISLRRGNRSKDMPGILMRPLDADDIFEMSQPGTFIVLEEDGALVSSTPTEGLSEIASYVAFIAGPTARTLRDARVWSPSGELDIDKMADPVLERFRLVERRSQQPKRALIPYTKPQIEFAQRAQGGFGSLFRGDGRWRD